MVTIKNINGDYGMPISHTAETLEQAVTEMQEMIRACGDDFADVELTAVDYEIVSE